MRNFTLKSLLTLAVLGIGTSAWADQLDDIEKKLTESYDKIKSLTAKMAVNMEMGGEGFKMVSTSTGTQEYMRKGDKMLYRMEMTTTGTTSVGGNDTKSNSTSVMISDGDFMYSYSDTDGQKSATKMKATSDMADTRNWLKQIRTDFNVKVLPDETVDGHECWVLEAIAKNPEQAAMGRTVWYYAKDVGWPVKSVSFGPDGKPVQTMTYSDIKINPDIAPDRFVFKAPEGVTVQDMTSETAPDTP